MHFLEAGRFLNALDLAGRKVNLLYAPQKSAVSADSQVDRLPPPPHSVWALKQPLCSHLHKITNEPVFLFGGF